MKRIVVLLLLILGINKNYSQEIIAEKSKFEASIGYGAAFIGISPDLESNNVVLRRASVGSFLSAAIDYEVVANKFVGFGYGFKQFVNTINQVAVRENTALLADNLKNVAQHHYYDLHLRRKYDKFNITVGLAYTVERYTDVREELLEDDFRVFILFSEPSPTPITLFLALDYMFPINQNMEIGLQGRVDYGVYGVDNMVLSPLLRLKF